MAHWALALSEPSPFGILPPLNIHTSPSSPVLFWLQFADEEFDFIGEKLTILPWGPKAGGSSPGTLSVAQLTPKRALPPIPRPAASTRGWGGCPGARLKTSPPSPGLHVPGEVAGPVWEAGLPALHWDLRIPRECLSQGGGRGVPHPAPPRWRQVDGGASQARWVPPRSSPQAGKYGGSCTSPVWEI